MLKLILYVGAVIGIGVLSACQTTGVSSVSTKDFVESSQVQERAPVNKFESGDTIEISIEVDGRLEVSRHRAVVNYAGAVTLPLVGDVNVGGLRPDSARQKIYSAYAGYYVSSPVVMLSSVQDLDGGEFGSVTVTGNVNSPGLVNITSSKGIRLTAVIQQSDGFSVSAKRSGILITRRNKSGKRIQLTVNYNDIGQSGDIDADVLLRDGDVIYVPERVF